jgi:hypothetical protein
MIGGIAAKDPLSTDTTTFQDLTTNTRELLAPGKKAA